MRIHTFDNWLNESENKSQEGVTPEQRELLNDSCRHYQKNNQMIQPQDAWWVNPETGLVDVGGNFVLDSEKWKSGLLGIRFGKIKGYFNIDGAGISDASELPREIGTHLNADRNRFRTLEGIGLVGGRLELDSNLLVSLEGLDPKKADWFMGFGNPVRANFMGDDLEEVESGKRTWLEVYVDILRGEYAIKRGEAEAKDWVLRNKFDAKTLEPLIKSDPEGTALLLAKIPAEYQEVISTTLDSISDLPPGFRDDFDPLSDLTSLGF